MAASPLRCQAGSKRPLIARIKNIIITLFKKIYFLKFNFAMEPPGHLNFAPRLHLLFKKPTRMAVTAVLRNLACR
jgi:hypothetical protein